MLQYGQYYMTNILITEYNMANILRVSHIWLSHFASFYWVREATAKYEESEKHRAITGLSLTFKISVVC